MTDLADHSAELQQRREAEILARHLARPDTSQSALATGCCIDCAQPIAPGRLAIYPRALRCTDCQSSADPAR